MTSGTRASCAGAGARRSTTISTSGLSQPSIRTVPIVTSIDNVLPAGKGIVWVWRSVTSDARATRAAARTIHTRALYFRHMHQRFSAARCGRRAVLGLLLRPVRDRCAPDPPTRTGAARAADLARRRARRVRRRSHGDDRAGRSGLLQLHELRIQRAAQSAAGRVGGDSRQRSRAGARRGPARSGPPARSVRVVRARAAVAGAPLRHPGRPHSADVRRDVADGVRQQQHPDRPAARVSVPDVDSRRCAAGNGRRSAAHARPRLAVEFSRSATPRRDPGCRSSTPAGGTPACRRTASPG